MDELLSEKGAWCLAKPDEVYVVVITSYSIHYTKLYEAIRIVYTSVSKNGLMNQVKLENGGS